MTSLDDMLKHEGVMMACEFSPDGKLIDYRAKGEMPRELAEKAAQYSATVTMLLNVLGESFTKLSGMSWSPQHCWHYSGGDYTCVDSGNRTLMIETKKADISAIVRAMMAESEEFQAQI